jgi:hypothetical protein
MPIFPSSEPKEGTMSTAFPHCGSDSSACRRKEITHLPASGGSGGGPQALRPARLQWLTNITTGSQIAAFRKWSWKMMDLALNSLRSVTPAKAGAPLGSRFGEPKLDSRLRGNDGVRDDASSTKFNPTSRAFRPFFLQNSDRQKAWQKHSPPFLFHAESGAHLS